MRGRGNPLASDLKTKIIESHNTKEAFCNRERKSMGLKAIEHNSERNHVLKDSASVKAVCVVYITD